MWSVAAAAAAAHHQLPQLQKPITAAAAAAPAPGGAPPGGASVNHHSVKRVRRLAFLLALFGHNFLPAFNATKAFEYGEGHGSFEKAKREADAWVAKLNGRA